jgi:phosphoribosylaminoimidazolecarboxamide formyltransferase/IMP cyclohydrolase
MLLLPSILGGRVKTLHPKVFGGILNRQDNESDVQQMIEFDIPQIDLVIVDLYPLKKLLPQAQAKLILLKNRYWRYFFNSRCKKT